MSTKDIILKELKKNYREFVSGQKIADMTGVSRTAIWKSINKLINEGYVIEAVNNKGYTLVSCPELNAGEIKEHIKGEIIGKEIIYFDEIDSTNNYAKKISFNNAKEGLVVVADKQTKGKGRIGREWCNDYGNSIQMSVVLTPKLKPEQMQIITLATAVAVLEGIRDFTDIDAGIKWPNDILANGKKICGILTEISCEADRINYIVIGIGVNVSQKKEDFDDSIADIATSVEIETGKKVERKKLIAQILFHLEEKYSTIMSGKTEDIVDMCKKYSVTLGKKIKLISFDSVRNVTAEDITPKGGLLVINENGQPEEIISGEISIR